MNFCENKSIRCINYEKFCINCGIIHDYEYVHHVSFKDYKTKLFYKKSIYKRKNSYIINVFIFEKLTKIFYYFSIIL